MTEEMTYAGVGVDYDAMDPFKRMAVMAGRGTATNLTRYHCGLFEVMESRGESVYLIELPDRFLAHVEEGLGTKNLVADAMSQFWKARHGTAGRSHYDAIAQDTVAMIVNDMITLGAMPLSVMMHLAVGDGTWFENQERARDLVDGWKRACNLARCSWGGGETPTLRDIVARDAVLLSGSATGHIFPKSRGIKGDIQDGDAIVVLESTGVHANGLTLARRIADDLPEEYLTPIAGGGSLTYGEALLQPTPIYVPFVDACLAYGVPVHYAVNITGHGWRKFMRHPGDFAYVIETLPTQLPIFDFIQEHGPVSEREMYATYNMGAGFALYVDREHVQSALSTLYQAGHLCGQPVRAFLAGHIERGPRKVVIEPKGIEFDASTLGVR